MTYKQKYDYFLVLDFEATCQQDRTIQKQEIIEFPVLKIDGRSFDIIDKFHEYVKPIHNPELSTFCTNLTGITQEMVNDGEPFPVVFDAFKNWMNSEIGDKEFLFVTCGDWDLKTMLPGQCQRENIEVPSYFRTWMNIKKTYAQVTGTFTKGMMPMLNELNLKHVGRHHSGIDDCLNIAHILEKLAELGTVFGATSVRKEERRQKYLSKSGDADNLPGAYGAIEYPECNIDLKNMSLYSNDMYPPLPSYEDSVTPRTFLKEPSTSEEPLGDDLVPDPEPPMSKSIEDVKYPELIGTLQSNILSKKFDSRDQAELTPLLCSAKYIESNQSMDTADRIVIEKRLRYFYLILSYNKRVANRDARSFTPSVVGIHVEPEILNRSGRGVRKHRRVKEH